MLVRSLVGACGVPLCAVLLFLARVLRLIFVLPALVLSEMALLSWGVGGPMRLSVIRVPSLVL